MPVKLILAVNPGSTSTKFALFEEEKLLFERNLAHSPLEMIGFKNITDQFGFRKDLIMKELVGRRIDFSLIAAVVGRGGLVKPIESGVYRVNEEMKKDLRECKRGEHASNLGALIADDIARNLPSSIALIVDPVVVDELRAFGPAIGSPVIGKTVNFPCTESESRSQNICLFNR